MRLPLFGATETRWEMSRNSLEPETENVKMDGFVSIEKTLKEARPEETNHLVHRVVEQTLCPICQDHMFVPFMTACGHNFCYECISSWLQEHESCPTCRTKVDEAPALNIALQNLALVLFTTTITVHGSTPPELERERQIKINCYKKDLQKHNLFNGIFKQKYVAMVDEEDGVQRCSNCHWEIEGDVCPNCNMRVSGANMNFDEEMGYYDDSLESDLEDYAYAREGQIRIPYDLEEDSDDDGFLDERPIEEIEVDSDDDGLSSDGSSPVRNGAYVPSFLLDEPIDLDSDGDNEGSSPLSAAPSWHGFDNDSTPARFLYESDDEQENDDIEEVYGHGPVSSDEDDSMPISSRTRPTPVVFDSDDE